MGKTVTSFLVTSLIAFTLVLQTTPVPAEPIRLKSGREVQIIDGKIPEKVAGDLFREAEALFKNGRLDFAREYWRLIIDKATGGVVARVKTAEEKAREVEYSSFLILRNDHVLRGKVKADLRTHLLGLEGKNEISLWQVEEIVAEYHVGYSQVSKTFYPLTLLEIRLRGRKVQTARITRELEFTVEAQDGTVSKAYLGKSYEILRPDHLDRQIEELATDKITKVVIFPQLKRSQ